MTTTTRPRPRAARATQRTSDARFHITQLGGAPSVVNALDTMRSNALSDGLSLSPHALEAAAGDHLSPLTVLEVRTAARRGRVVEVRRTENHADVRLLVRDGGVCVVLSLRHAMVVTCWYNAPDDDHATLRRDRYVPLTDAAGLRSLMAVVAQGQRYAQAHRDR